MPPAAPLPAPDGNAPPPGCAWYGKLPGVGDFAARRMPYGLQQFWDRWGAAGLEALAALHAQRLPEVWQHMPPWAFLLPEQPAIAHSQLGVWAPSCDRVGRKFPLVVTLPLGRADLPALLPHASALAHAWAAVIGQAQRERWPADLLDQQLEATGQEALHGPHDTEDPEQTLPRGASPATLPWPNLPSTFDPGGTLSYWWSVPAHLTGFRARQHEGPLDSALALGLSQ